MIADPLPAAACLLWGEKMLCSVILLLGVPGHRLMLLFWLGLSPPDPIPALHWGKAVLGPVCGHQEVWVLARHCQPPAPRPSVPQSRCPA